MRAPSTSVVPVNSMSAFHCSPWPIHALQHISPPQILFPPSSVHPCGGQYPHPLCTLHGCSTHPRLSPACSQSLVLRSTLGGQGDLACRWPQVSLAF